MYASRAALSGTRAFIPLFVYFLGEDRLEEIGAQGLPLGISSQFVSDPPKLLELK